jgi:ABC-type Zn uptake system ZnuABC Zn-binding protein ZnuA
MRRFVRFTLLLLIVLAVLPVQAQDDTPVQVTVSILPQQYFVERIGGDDSVGPEHRASTACLLRP